MGCENVRIMRPCRHVPLAVGLAASLLAPGTLRAQAFAATYAFTWAGLEVGEFRAEVVERDGGYRAVWQGRTVGLVGTLFPFASEGASRGLRQDGVLRPGDFEGRSAWRDGGGFWRVVFGPDGRAERVEVPPEDVAEREPVPEGLRVGPDPATLALTALAVARPQARLSATSFDGKRAVRYALACDAPAGGAAELPCTIEAELLAGASRRWRDRRTQERRPPVRVWLRPGIRDGGLWPVRIEAESRFGRVEARLVRVERLGGG
jgi:hypothetical protein